MNWADSIPLVSALGAVFVAGGAWFQLKALQRAQDRLEDRQDKSASSQGTRIGELESWRFALERETKAVRRARMDLLTEQHSKGVVSSPMGPDEDST